MTQPDNLGAALDAAMAWWRDAGVDCAFVDQPQDWLAATSLPDPAKAQAQRAAMMAEEKAPPPPMIGGARDTWPEKLEDFAGWWLTEPSLAPAGAPRVPPSGPVGAALMILVAMPEADDTDRLLSGKAGVMLGAALAAMGLEPGQIYYASALPARIAMPDWPALAAQGLGDVLARHVALARPQRLLIFGESGISTLLGNDSPHSAANLHSFNHEGGTVPAISAYDLEAMLAKPAFKARLWNRWLDWTGS